MTLIGLDDTDSRERGMCTTYVAARIADRIEAAGGSVERRVLVRLDPAVERKTRGNAALALHADVDVATAADVAGAAIEAFAVADDPRTSPGLVVADGPPAAVPDPIAGFARAAVRERCALADARDVLATAGYRHREWAGGHGLIGALAAVGAWRAFADREWTYERIAYRERDRRGTPREVDRDSVFAAADAGYPAVWDTVDRGEGEAVCVPSAPGPILHGVRGDDADAVRTASDRIRGEPVERTALFLTNQGTDAHHRAGRIGDLRDGRAYRVDGVVADAPATRAGGHVFLTLAPPGDADSASSAEATETPNTGSDANGAVDAAGDVDADADSDRSRLRLDCVAFEPTKRFRDRVRALRPGDQVTACGECADGTLKLEKFAVRDLDRTERVVPDCPDCGRSMSSAGRDQGYRCRDCDTDAPDRVAVRVDRDLEPGWYEVPPCARRHVAKPLVRGGFDAPVHPER